ncbi:MAG: hypothetical protein ABUK01_10415 [Leptospirales bacterium]
MKYVVRIHENINSDLHEKIENVNIENALLPGDLPYSARVKISDNKKLTIHLKYANFNMKDIIKEKHGETNLLINKKNGRIHRLYSNNKKTLMQDITEIFQQYSINTRAASNLEFTKNILINYSKSQKVTKKHSV